VLSVSAAAPTAVAAAVAVVGLFVVDLIVTVLANTLMLLLSV
jgi:hypothetical protein